MSNQNFGNNFEDTNEQTVNIQDTTGQSAERQDTTERTECVYTAQPNTYAEPPTQPVMPNQYQPPPQYPYNPQYSNQNPYNPYLNGTMVNNAGSGQAIAGMILGILSILNIAVPFFGTLMAIVGIILSGFGLKSKNRGMAITGLVLGILSLIISLIITIGFIALIAYDSSPHTYWY